MEFASNDTQIMKEMISSMGKNHELEVSFPGNSYETFARIVAWMVHTLSTTKTVDLDIIYQPLRYGHSIKTFRFTINVSFGFAI